MNAEHLFTSQLDLIDGVIESICRRHCCGQDECEDFASWARLKLIDNDYAILAKFQGRSSLSTYLTTVIHNLFRDYRISKWGKWRPSAAAKKRGPEAVQLETLLRRDGLSVPEAIEILKANYGVRTSRDELEALASELPTRPQRQMADLETVREPGIDGGVDHKVVDGELEALAARTADILGEALATLDAEDRLILRMRFQDGFTVAGIASALDLEPRPLYRRIHKCLARLRLEFERRGLAAEELRDLYEWHGLELSMSESLDVSV